MMQKFDRNYDFGAFDDNELIKLEASCWESLAGESEANVINAELRMLQLYCTGKKIFVKKQDFINLVSNKIPDATPFFKKIYNTMLNTLEIADKKTRLSSKPLALSVKLTHKCDILCKFCDCHESEWEISADTHDQIMELMPFLHEIGWTGGEIFLYEKFNELFKCAKDNGVHQEIITNSMLLNNEWIDEIITSNTKLAISIRSFDKATYEMLSKGAVFEKLIANLEYLNANGNKKHKNFELAMYVLVTKYNFKELGKIIDFAKIYGFNTVRFIQLNNREDMPESENICGKTSEYYEDLFEIAEQAANKAAEYGIKLLNELPLNIPNCACSCGDAGAGEKLCRNDFVSEKNPDFDLKKFLADVVYCSEKTELFCRRPWNSMLISNNGGVVFNCFCLNEKPVGNSSRNSLLEIWNSDAARNFRTKILNDTYLDVCNSMCVKYGVHK